MVKHANKARRDKGRLQPFVPLLIETLDTPAWRAMSHGAKALYVCLKRRCFAPDNNGRVYLSYRKAREQLRSGTDEIGRWFRELEHYGFIVQTEPGYLGVEGLGRSPHWRANRTWNPRSGRPAEAADKGLCTLGRHEI